MLRYLKASSGSFQSRMGNIVLLSFEALQYQYTGFRQKILMLSHVNSRSSGHGCFPDLFGKRWKGFFELFVFYLVTKKRITCISMCQHES